MLLHSAIDYQHYHFHSVSYQQLQLATNHQHY